MASERMTAEELAEIRADVDDPDSRGIAPRGHCLALLAELDAVTRERDEAIREHHDFVDASMRDTDAMHKLADIVAAEAEQRGYEHGEDLRAKLVVALRNCRDWMARNARTQYGPGLTATLDLADRALAAATPPQQKQEETKGNSK